MQPDECEDYLEALIKYSVNTIKPENLDIIAEALEKDPSQVERGLKELENEGFVITGDDKSITLTEKGRKTGECTIRKHQVLEAFLTEMLGMEPDAASKEACILEHGTSEDTIRRLKNHLRGPKRCRWHGREHKRQGIQESGCGSPLTVFNEDETVRILFTAGQPGRTNRLHDLGIIPGENMTIKRKLSNGAMVVVIKSCEVGLSPEIASSVFAERI